MNRTRTARISLWCLLLSSWSFLTIPAQAQSIGNVASHQVTLRVAEVAVLSLDDPRPLDLLVAPRSAMGIVSAGRAEGSKTLHYTTVNAAGVTRKVSVQWSAGGSAPAGTALKIRAANVPVGCGLAAPEVTMSGAPQVLITAIPSCATGASDRGASLRYRLAVEDESRLSSGENTSITVVFTLVDQ